MTAPKNGRATRPQPKPAHPILLKVIVQAVGVVIHDGTAVEVAGEQVAIPAAEWDTWAAGLKAGFESSPVDLP